MMCLGLLVWIGGLVVLFGWLLWWGFGCCFVGWALLGVIAVLLPTDCCLVGFVCVSCWIWWFGVACYRFAVLLCVWLL